MHCKLRKMDDITTKILVADEEMFANIHVN